MPGTANYSQKFRVVAPFQFIRGRMNSVLEVELPEVPQVRFRKTGAELFRQVVRKLAEKLRAVSRLDRGVLKLACQKRVLQVKRSYAYRVQ